jgi:hypothetical protein
MRQVEKQILLQTIDEMARASADAGTSALGGRLPRLCAARPAQRVQDRGVPAVLPGDGIGPEVMAEVRKVIDWFARSGGSIST